MLEAIHTAVPGRARFRVRGLNGSNGVKEHFEKILSQRKGIKSVSASAVTGTVLVHFDPAVDLAGIEKSIQSAFSELSRLVPKPANPKPLKALKKATPTSQHEKRAKPDAQQLRVSVREKLKHLSHLHEAQAVQSWHACSTSKVLITVGFDKR